MDTQTDSGAPAPDALQDFVARGQAAQAAVDQAIAAADAPVASLPAEGQDADAPLPGEEASGSGDPAPALGDAPDAHEGPINPARVAAFFQRSGAPQALIDVLLERMRQVDELGYTAEHDDGQAPEQFAAAAAGLCLDASMALAGEATSDAAVARNDAALDAIDAWYPKNRHWTPSNSRTNLVHAAAYCLAQVERHDRRIAAERAAAAGAKP